MRFLRNVLAENEAHVARYYMRRKAYVASLNRSKVILSQYHGTPATEEALALMVTIYGILGLTRFIKRFAKSFKTQLSSESIFRI